jgi:hypothetical protein
MPTKLIKIESKKGAVGMRSDGIVKRIPQEQYEKFFEERAITADKIDQAPKSEISEVKPKEVGPGLFHLQVEEMTPEKLEELKKAFAKDQHPDRLVLITDQQTRLTHHDKFDIGIAARLLRAGKSIRRLKWPKSYLVLLDGAIALKHPDGTSIYWQPLQEDILANDYTFAVKEDWAIINGI